jgi:putative RNA 2'-phosphotransferase
VNEKQRTRLSKFLSLHLRHDPASLGLTLADGGWVKVDDLLPGAASSGFPFSRLDLEEVVRSSDKQRFAFDATGTLIRANQGHSVEVDLQLPVADPPAELFHGTAERTLALILRDGLLKMQRHHVHLSPDTATARKVGQRHGKPMILRIDAATMHADGYSFYLAANGVWLVDHVPPRYLRLVSPSESTQ